MRIYIFIPLVRLSNRFTSSRAKHQGPAPAPRSTSTSTRAGPMLFWTTFPCAQVSRISPLPCLLPTNRYQRPGQVKPH